MSGEEMVNRTNIRLAREGGGQEERLPRFGSPPPSHQFFFDLLPQTPKMPAEEVGEKQKATLAVSHRFLFCFSDKDSQTSTDSSTYRTTTLIMRQTALADNEKIKKDNFKSLYFNYSRAVFNYVPKVVLEFLWFCTATLCDWPFYQPIRSKTKINRVLLAGVFPRLAPATCICFEF